MRGVRGQEEGGEGVRGRRGEGRVCGVGGGRGECVG